MAAKWFFHYFLILVVSLSFSGSTLSQDNKLSDIFAVVDGPYKLKSEIGIVGFVTQRTGEKVLFQPCTGEAQEVAASELERTQNNCADGEGDSFASTCVETYKYESIANTLIQESSDSVEIGNIYKASNDILTVEPNSSSIFARKLHQLKACSDIWTIAYDENGNMIAQLLAIDSRLLNDSSDPIWKQ